MEDDYMRKKTILKKLRKKLLRQQIAREKRLGERPYLIKTLERKLKGKKKKKRKEVHYEDDWRKRLHIVSGSFEMGKRR